MMPPQKFMPNWLPYFIKQPHKANQANPIWLPDDDDDDDKPPTNDLDAWPALLEKEI